MKYIKKIHILFWRKTMALALVLGAQVYMSGATVTPNVAWTGIGPDTLSVKLPANTVEGRLPNGLHYLILPNGSPARTVEMRLVMRVGSVQETECQKGCAHFLEHMAFAGTRHFPQRTMIDYLEGLGMKFGRDINAVTGYDRTVFMLTVPMTATDLGVLDSTLLVLKDWLTGVSFEAVRVRQERGVILEELRTYRNDDVFYDLKIGQSRFRDRMPLGSADDIRSVKRRQLLDFYKKWYTPQLASLVVVGDVSPLEVEKRIHRLFSGIPKHEVDSYRVYPLTYDKGVQFCEVRDSIHHQSVLELMVPHPSTVGRDVPATVLKERERLAAYALDRRLSARHIPCLVSDEWYLSDLNHFVLSISGKNKKQLLQVVERVSSEMQSLISVGWHPTEMAHLKTAFCATLAARDAAQSSYAYCEDFNDYILQGDRYIYDEAELSRVKVGVMATDTAFLQRRLLELADRMEQSLLLAYRNNAGETDSLTAGEIVSAWHRGKSKKAAPYVYHSRKVVESEVPIPGCLLQAVPDIPGAVLSERYFEDTRLTEVRLKNGIRLIFRPTPESEETLLLNLFGRGGLAQLRPEIYHRYESTAGFMEMGGIARVPYDTLCEYMSQSGLLLNISIGAYWHDLLATSPANRCSELFRLIAEKLQRPELCYADFEEVRQDELESMGQVTVLDRMMQRAPDRLLVNRMDSLVGNSPSTWFRKKTREDLEQMNLDSIASYFRSLYAQPASTTVVMTGNYDLDVVKRLAIATFASMREQPLRDEWQGNPCSFSFPKTKYVEGFDHDHPSQTVLEYVYPGHFVPSLRAGLILKLMRDLLQDRMLRTLRERENIVYSPYAALYYHGAPQNSYYFNLSLSVDRDNSEEADRLVGEIISELQRQPVSVAELDKLKRAFLVNKSQVLTESAATSWRDIIATLVKNGESLDDFENYQRQLDAITPETVRQAFCRYLIPERGILLYLGEYGPRS